MYAESGSGCPLKQNERDFSNIHFFSAAFYPHGCSNDMKSLSGKGQLKAFTNFYPSL